MHFHPGVTSPLRKADDTHLDWVVVRENSEGEYAGLGGRNLSARGPGNEVALQTALFTEKGCERIIRFAFDLARTRPVKKVSSVTKSNAQQYGMVLWDETFTRVAPDYPDVACESVLVDAMSAKFVLKPEDLYGALMLDHFGLRDEAARLQKAVDAATGSGVLTRDIGGTASTDEVVAAIIRNLGL